MGGEIGDGAGVSPADLDSDAKKKKLVAKIIEIKFDSGIELKEKKKKVVGPHWKYRRKKIRPACYARKSGGGKKTLTVKINITKLENLSGNAVLVGESSELKIKSDVFSLKKGKSKPIDCKFEEFPDVLLYYNKSAIVWTIEHGGEKYPVANSTAIILFVIFNRPAKPWTATGAKAVWVEALKFLFENTGIDFSTSKRSAAAAITRFLHSSYKLRYDTKVGGSGYCDLYGTSYKVAAARFDLTGYLKRKTKKSRSGKIVNCYDQAAGVTVLTAAIGVGSAFKFMDPYGYINTTTLVSHILTNNPFHKNPSYSSMKIWTSKAKKPRSPFGNHAFAKYNAKIYDACAGPDTGSRSAKKYLKNAIDYNPPFDSRAGDESDIQKGAIAITVV